jgi:hypothetical protein
MYRALECHFCAHLFHLATRILVEKHEITETTYANLIHYYNNNSEKKSSQSTYETFEDGAGDHIMRNFASLSSIDTSRLQRQASITLSQFSPSVSSLTHNLTMESPPTVMTVNHQLYNVIRHPAGTDAKSTQYLQVEDSHPAHSFPDFVRAMGPNIFVLWKAAILKKRILILTSSPVERACQFGEYIDLDKDATVILPCANTFQPVFQFITHASLLPYHDLMSYR